MLSSQSIRCISGLREDLRLYRAILLAAMKPAGTDIMSEFYKDHTNDPDTKGKVILDPFMGGGTTIVEALRLGCNVIGIDLNPVAWFIVKTEVEEVDIDKLKDAFERLAERKVEWSGKPLKETLLELYKTECPGCGNKDADIIYTFWVKSAPCTTALCTAFTPLFPDYIVAAKTPSIKYFPDVQCPHCKEKFDWEKEPASMVADEQLMINAGKFSAGEGRTSARWAYSQIDNVVCPWCNNDVKPFPSKAKQSRKKVNLTVLNCSNCEEVWQLRGPLSETVECPTCKHSYNPKEGNIPNKGKFICHGTCQGNVDNIINAIRKHPANELLPVKPYAIEGYCEHCATKNDDKVIIAFDEDQISMDDTSIENVKEKNDRMKSTTVSMIWKNNGKFFKKVTPSDAAKYISSVELWNKEKSKLPYPKSEIPDGVETHRLLEHHYKYWHQMFNDRQLLGLSTLLKAIAKEENQVLKEMLLSGLITLLENNNLFARYNKGRHEAEGVFARHDYQPKTTITEGNLWGSKYGKNNIERVKLKIIEGKEFCKNVFDRIVTNNDIDKFFSREIITSNKKTTRIYNDDSKKVMNDAFSVDVVITDPPYAGNVNYSELSDFFYVWLRLLLNNVYMEFAPEHTPKTEEIIENRTRNKSAEDFKEGISSVFKECNRVLKDNGLLAFTFHHSEGKTWENLLEAICDAGFFIEAVYPIHGEAENSLHLMDKANISYDLIHVCKKLENNQNRETRSWATIRNDIRKKAREEVKKIEAGNYGKGLSGPDVNLILIGKCLELYSKHYGKIVDHEDKPFPMKAALEQIRMMVDQIITKDNPVPSELENIDVPSYVFMTSLYAIKEIKSDNLHKSTRGLIEPAILKEAGLIVKGREKRGGTFEVKQPIDRLNELKTKFREKGDDVQEELFDGLASRQDGFLFVDYLQLLLGVAASGENLIPWLEKFRGKVPLIRAACNYLIERKRYTDECKKILGLIDERTLFNTNIKEKQ